VTANDPELRAQLVDHEGLRLKPYMDTVGKLTIGVGRNLTDVGISPNEAMVLLSNDLDHAIADLRTFPWFDGLSRVRQRALIDMRLNLGPRGFRTFTNTIAHIAAGRYTSAAAGMRASKWARQTGRRARRLAIMMETNTDPGPQMASSRESAMTYTPKWNHLRDQILDIAAGVIDCSHRRLIGFFALACCTM